MAEGQEDLPHAIILRVLLKSSPQILNTRYQIPNNNSRSISLSVKSTPHHILIFHIPNTIANLQNNTKRLSHTPASTIYHFRLAEIDQAPKGKRVICWPDTYGEVAVGMHPAGHWKTVSGTSEWGLVVPCWHASQQWRWADCMLAGMMGLPRNFP